MAFNYGCVNNVSDEDCGKCMIRGFIYGCPNRCSDFDDGRGNSDEHGEGTSEWNDNE